MNPLKIIECFWYKIGKQYDFYIIGKVILLV